MTQAVTLYSSHPFVTLISPKVGMLTNAASLMQVQNLRLECWNKEALSLFLDMTMKPWSPEELPAATWDLSEAEIRDENTSLCARTPTHYGCHGSCVSEGPGSSAHGHPREK